MVHLSVIQLIKTDGSEHEEERIYGAELAFYPPYKAGDTLFLQHITPYLEMDKLRLSQFIVVDVHHSLRTIEKTFLGSTTYASMDVYVRKID